MNKKLENILKSTPKTKNEWQARASVLQDILDEKDETTRMTRGKKVLWSVRAVSQQIEYWTISSFNLPISILIWIVTKDYWKALGFYTFSIILHTAGNLRGLFLHIENLIEWIAKKRI